MSWNSVTLILLLKTEMCIRMLNARKPFSELAVHVCFLGFYFLSNSILTVNTHSNNKVEPFSTCAIKSFELSLILAI